MTHMTDARTTGNKGSLSLPKLSENSAFQKNERRVRNFYCFHKWKSRMLSIYLHSSQETTDFNENLYLSPSDVTTPYCYNVKLIMKWQNLMKGDMFETFREITAKVWLVSGPVPQNKGETQVWGASEMVKTLVPLPPQPRHVGGPALHRSSSAAAQRMLAKPLANFWYRDQTSPARVRGYRWTTQERVIL